MKNELEVSFDDINWGEVGMLIEEKKPAPVVKHTSVPAPVVEAKKPWARVITVCAILIMLGVVLVSFMVSNADAGMAFMRFTVFEITEETVIVVDEHEDFFTFYKEDDFPEMKKGDEVMVCTDLTYNGRDKWEWNRGRTSIIEVKP